MVLGDWSSNNLKNLLRILRCFKLVSGLEINSKKCCLLGLNVSAKENSSFASLVNCKVSSLPFNYLGITIGANMNLAKNWQPVIDKFESRLSSWKSKHLSFAGRLVLIRAVLESLPGYFFSLFKAPDKVIHKLERIRRRFLWGGNGDSFKIPWVSWDKVCATKENGGLGIGSLKIMNISLLSKWWWRFKVEASPLWKQVITCLHQPSGDSLFIPVRKSFSGVWNSIVKIKSFLLQKNIAIEQLIIKSSGSWLWVGDSSGAFSVKSFRTLLNQQSCQPTSFIYEWSTWVPKKANILVWRAELDRIPTRNALIKRNVPIDDAMCPLCSQLPETVDHLFISCYFASMAWAYISSWCKLPPIFAFHIKDLLSIHKSANSKSKEAIYAVIITTFWSIWKMRNGVIFDNQAPSVKKLLEDIKSSSFFWVKSRGKFDNLDWNGWIKFRF